MSDVSKCPGIGCREREQCWRHMAPTSAEGQSWAPFDLSRKPGEACEYFLPIKERKP